MGGDGRDDARALSAALAEGEEGNVLKTKGNYLLLLVVRISFLIFAQGIEHFCSMN